MRRDEYKHNDYDSCVRPGARKMALVVLAIAVAIFACGHTIVGWMMQGTRGINWVTPPGSSSIAAAQHANLYFPMRMKGAIVIAVEALPGTPTVLTEAVAKFSRNVSERVQQDVRVQPYAPIVVGYYLNQDLPESARKLLQVELVTPDRHMTVIVIQPTKMEGQWNAAASFLEEFCASPPPGFTLHITGMMAVVSGDGCFSGVHKHVDTRSMSFEQLFHAELVTIPIALFIIGKLVKYYIKLLVLPLLTLVITFVLTSAMMIVFMDYGYRIPHDVPAAMGSVVLALSLDYGLFFLTRFSEQHTEGMPLQRNVDTILRHTGHTISVSGTLVAISFFASMILPEEVLKGTGLVMGIATICAMITSMAFIPAVLLIAGPKLTGSIVRTPVDTDMQAFGFTQRQEMNEVSQSPPQAHTETSHWLKMMRHVNHSPGRSIVMVLLLMYPILLQLPHLSISGDRFAMMPMGMVSMKALRRVQANFPVGILDPYSIVVTAPPQVASARLSREVLDGVADLGHHQAEVNSLAASNGLSAEDRSAFAKAVKGLKGGDVTPADLATTVDCKTLAAVSAGAALGINSRLGVSDADALKAALRAAHKTGCSPSDIQEAVGASASVLYADKGKAHDSVVDATHAANRKADSINAQVAVRDEAVKLGLSQSASTQLADRIARATDGSHRAQEQEAATTASVRAGLAVGVGRLHGRSDTESLKDALRAVNDLDMSMGDAEQVLRAVLAIVQKGTDEADDSSKKVEMEARRQGLNEHAASVIAVTLMAMTKKGSDDAHISGNDKAFAAPVAGGAQMAGSAVATHGAKVDDDFNRKWKLILNLVGAVDKLTGKDHGMLLMPSGFKAMMDLCNAVDGVGDVASMLGPTWAFHQPIDWVTALGTHLNSTGARMYNPLLASHVNANKALLEVHTTFPSIGPGGADWVLAVRKALATWEESHPGYKAELSGGASEAADTRAKVLGAMWPYLGVCVSLIMVVVFFAFRSVMVPLRLAFALFFTMAATYGTAVIIYQTSLLHGIFPWLAQFHGLTFEVVPMVSGVAIALGLDYDILLVTRIIEFRLQGFTDRASVFRGATKAGGVISGAGLIMALAFSGLCFSDKLLMQQFGVLLVVSVIFDTFVVRTILVPALMLIAQDWNWWPRQMPPAIYNTLEGEMKMEGDYLDALYERMLD